MKKLIKELYKSGTTNREVLLYEAEFINQTSKDKQNTLITKLRETTRKEKQFTDRLLLRFNWVG